MSVNGEQLYLRTDVAGLLDRLGVEGKDLSDPNERLDAGSFSIVIGEPHGKIRKIPTLYFGNAPVFADRDVAAVGERFHVMVDAVARYRDNSIYAVNGCEFNGRRGLYCRDLFNRSTFRLRARPLGLRFADDPHVQLAQGSSFRNSDYGVFEPEFIVYQTEFSDELTRKKGGLLLWIVSTYRLGIPPSDEVGRLGSIIGALEAVGGGNPSEVTEVLEQITN